MSIEIEVARSSISNGSDAFQCAPSHSTLEQNIQAHDQRPYDSELEGCYLHHDKKKRIWIGSSIPAGEGEHAYFEGRSKKHIDNSKSLDGMVKYKFCRRYPVAGLKNLEKRMGILSSLESIVEWYLIRRKWQHSALLMTTIVHGNFQKLQFDAVAYLYEICYDIMLIATEHNVSESPGLRALD